MVIRCFKTILSSWYQMISKKQRIVLFLPIGNFFYVSNLNDLSIFQDDQVIKNRENTSSTYLPKYTSLKSTGQLLSHICSWKHENTLDRLGPNGETKVTPSICLQIWLSILRKLFCKDIFNFFKKSFLLKLFILSFIVKNRITRNIYIFLQEYVRRFTLTGKKSKAKQILLLKLLCSFAITYFPWEIQQFYKY